MIIKPRPKSQKRPLDAKLVKHDPSKPLIAHIHEIRRRLFWVVSSLVVASIGGYIIHETLLEIIRRPLGQTLYYTSPVGGLNFLLKLCLTFGVIVALPVLMYQIVRFLRPLFTKLSTWTVVRYLACSALFAYAGVAFAYFVSLPAALHFLGNFGGENITSLITADEYYSFALAYLTGFALLFQLPIIILFTNRIKPLKPGKMMKLQRYLIVASFIVAAILTPTPDPVNQAIMAMPAVMLYQVSLFLVWLINRKRNIDVVLEPALQVPNLVMHAVNSPDMQLPATTKTQPALPVKAQLQSQPHPQPTQIISDFMRVSVNPQPASSSQREMPKRQVVTQPAIDARRQPRRVVDDMIVRRQLSTS